MFSLFMLQLMAYCVCQVYYKEFRSFIGLPSSFTHRNSSTAFRTAFHGHVYWKCMHADFSLSPILNQLGESGTCAASQPLAKWGHWTTWLVRTNAAAFWLVHPDWEGKWWDGRGGVTWPNPAESMIIGLPSCSGGQRERERERSLDKDQKTPLPHTGCALLPIHRTPSQATLSFN